MNEFVLLLTIGALTTVSFAEEKTPGLTIKWNNTTVVLPKADRNEIGTTPLPDANAVTKSCGELAVAPSKTPIEQRAKRSAKLLKTPTRSKRYQRSLRSAMQSTKRKTQKMAHRCGKCDEFVKMLKEKLKGREIRLQSKKTKDKKFGKNAKGAKFRNASNPFSTYLRMRSPTGGLIHSKEPS